MTMNKITAMASMIVLLTLVGCMTFSQPKEDIIYNAGYISAVIWVEKQGPSDAVKSNIVDTISFVTKSVSSTNVTSYSQTLIPIVNNYVDNYNNLATNDKKLVKVGITYALLATDGLIAQINKEEIASTSTYAYLTSFSKGFSDGIKVSFNSEVNYVIKSEHIK